MTLLSRSLLVAATCLLLTSGQASSVRLLASVLSNLDHAQACLAQDQFAEAQAYADMTLLARTVRYSVTNDSGGYARRALDCWESSLGDGLAFVEVAPNQADLQIDFRPSVRATGRDVFGLAITRRSVKTWNGGDFTYRVTGSIVVGTNAPDGLPASPDTVLNTAIHEVGHFLGLDDSLRLGDVMGPIDLRRPTLAPNVEEVGCLLQLRQSALLVSYQASASS